MFAVIGIWLDILDILFNHLGATALKAEWLLPNPPKCPRLYLGNH